GGKVRVSRVAYWRFLSLKSGKEVCNSRFFEPSMLLRSVESALIATVRTVGRFSLRSPLAQSLLKGIQHDVAMGR
ncbi:hypothetical protein, partial [Acetobacter orleanensis]|uniref:hypothetical protein n=1 Tax=Acetobacter orleanensis TaxID=104099 RepID=UPI001C3FD323